MTKQHFEDFAAYIKDTVTVGRPKEAALLTAEHMARMVAAIAKRYNPRFDESRFRHACGLEE